MVFNNQQMIPMFISFIILISVSIILLYKRKMTKKIAIIILTFSVLVPGFILSSAASPVFLIQQIFTSLYTILHTTIVNQLLMQTIIMLSIMLTVFIVITILFGRIFCSYACPLGACQELASKILFPSKLNELKKKRKYTIRIPNKVAKIFRFGVFISMTILSMVWGIALFEVINPFAGFGIFWNLSNITLAEVFIPIILLTVIIVSSFFVYRPWCRFFCPFGMIADLISRFSIIKFSRTDKCTKCKACEKICPTGEAFADSNKSECYTCIRCVEICPVNALKFGRKVRKDYTAE
ncbi:MAG: 4Fe-4S binding protein [Candidatus Helarchaeota archaeon]